MKKKKVLTIFLLLLIAVFGSRLRVYTIDGNKEILYKNFSYTGSGSARADIAEDFEAHGKLPENIESIEYIGSKGSGVYYLCKYLEPDGTESSYYAFDDTDTTCLVRAKVIWK